MNPPDSTQNNSSTTSHDTHAPLCFGLSPKRKQSSRRQTAAIPTAPRQKETKALQSLTMALANYGDWLVFALEQHHRQLQHGHWGGGAPFNIGDQTAALGKHENTAIGAAALQSTRIGADNTADGWGRPFCQHLRQLQHG